MRHPVLLTLSFFLIAFFTLLQLNIDYRLASPTGAVVAEEEKTHYAYTLDHVINRFLRTAAVYFPRGECGDTAQALYESLALQPLEVTSGYQTTQEGRVAALNFGMDRTIGSLDMITGETLNQNNPEDTFVSINSHSTIRMPPGVARLTGLRMNLYGTNNGLFIVERGTFSTPALECSFTTEDGNANCSCNVYEPESTTDDSWTEA